jgi:small subunit ribosomal protein S1
MSANIKLDNLNEILETNNLTENIPQKEDFASLLEASMKHEKKEGMVVQGTVVAVDDDAVYVDVGLKSEGRIPLKEFTEALEDGEKKPAPEVGDLVDVYIERFEGRGGASVLSREKAVREEAWAKFEQLYQQDATVEGIIIGRVKSGFAVKLNGLYAFLPNSQVDIRPIKDVSALLDVVQPFRILKMDRDQGNVVVSRRAIIEESRMEARNELLSNVQEGSVLEGVVKNITDYGAFIDLGSVDGLLHITDISWNKLAHPSEKLRIGQNIKVMVIKYNPEMRRISLGLKQLEKNPWDGLEDKYKPGDTFKGVITTIADYGVFVELEQGVEGLVYHTEIDWNAKNMHPRKLVKPGQEVEVMVLETDIVKHRISLSIKQCKENPWKLFVDTHPVGTVVEGVVKNIADFGIFLALNEGNPDLVIDALVPAVELSWDEKPEVALKKYKEGDTLRGVVLTSDVERERVTIGVKQLEENGAPSEINFNKGDTVTCTIQEITKDGLQVEVQEGLTAFIKRADLSKHKAEQRADRFAIGERVDAQVTMVDKTSRKISLSIKALEIDEQKKAIEEYGSTSSGASLGDILGAALGRKPEGSDENK